MTLPGAFPSTRAATIQKLVEAFVSGRPRLLAPSFGRRRGHPVCLAREGWPEGGAVTPPPPRLDAPVRPGAPLAPSRCPSGRANGLALTPQLAGGGPPLAAGCYAR